MNGRGGGGGWVVRGGSEPAGRPGQDRRGCAGGGTQTRVVRRARAEASPSGTSGNGLPESSNESPEEGPEVLALPTGTDGFEPADVLEALRVRGLRRVLVEGGGVTVSRFLEAGLLHRLHLTVAPVLMGSGRSSITLPVIETLDQALRARCRHVPLGDDLLFDLDLS